MSEQRVFPALDAARTQLSALRFGRAVLCRGIPLTFEESLRESLVADLHDGLGQYIALAQIKLAALRGASNAELRAPLGELERLMGRADRSLRAIAFQLSPLALDESGLVPALEWLAEDLGARHGIEVRIENESWPSLNDRGLRVILFRAVRELLLGAATRGGAQLIWVRLAAEERTLRVCIDGSGEWFGSDAVGSEDGAWAEVREQLERAGGSMELDTRPGRGTALTLRAPVSS